MINNEGKGSKTKQKNYEVMSHEHSWATTVGNVTHVAFFVKMQSLTSPGCCVLCYKGYVAHIRLCAFGYVTHVSHNSMTDDNGWS